jgi:hypothetical protein
MSSNYNFDYNYWTILRELTSGEQRQIVVIWEKKFPRKARVW